MMGWWWTVSDTYWYWCFFGWLGFNLGLPYRWNLMWDQRAGNRQAASGGRWWARPKPQSLSQPLPTARSCDNMLHLSVFHFAMPTPSPNSNLAPVPCTERPVLLQKNVFVFAQAKSQCPIIVFVFSLTSKKFKSYQCTCISITISIVYLGRF